MLSQLDLIIFPDRCEVYEIIPSQRYVYPIFKNGSSSLLTYCLRNKCRTLLNEQLRRLDSIDVVLRDPGPRLISGINTYLQQVLNTNPGLDRTTAIWFIKNYLYLNRHYCPQLFWIFNLSRYIKEDTVINFIGMKDINTIINEDIKPRGFDAVPEGFSDEIGEIPGHEMYERLDLALFKECVGKSLTFLETMTIIKKSDRAAYDWVIGRFKKISKPIYALPED